MKLIVDTNTNRLEVTHDGSTTIVPLYSPEGFEALSDLWVKVGWQERYSYTFSWFGRPMIQLPEDVMRMQEVIFSLRPDFIVETGVAHGGSLIFYASLFEAMGHGQVIGIDIEIRPQNRAAIEAHPMAKRIQLVEGSSVAPEIVADVKNRIPPGSTVIVILDSDHSKSHVSAELECYCDLVTYGSYIVATDGIMSLAADVPRGNPEWIHDNPTEAAREFSDRHPEFILEQPAWIFNESQLTKSVTHWPGAWLRRSM